jgi:hypothetical protein
MIVNNCHFSAKWSVWEIFNNLRKCALKAPCFDDLKYSAGN